AGTYTVKPQVGGSDAGALAGSVTLTAGIPGAAYSTLTTDGNTITADGTDSTTLTITARDGNNNPATGIAGQLSFALQDSYGQSVLPPDVIVGTLTETVQGSGIYTTTLTGTRAGTYTVTAQYNGTAIGTGNTVTLIAGEPDYSVSTFSTPAPQSITADGTTTSTLSFTAKDVNG
ncbi:invasin domain 3-containing protein, partial [Citrobacter koseri]|uniref:invasin domain 3-containing protein n=1 Tax=Citrobacter koseri TaxID=545 RepID=UPI001F28FBA4